MEAVYIERKGQMAKRKTMWDNYKVVGVVRKSDYKKLIVAIGCKDGARYIIIREFVHFVSLGEWRPNKRYLAIPLKYPIDGGTTILEPFNALLYTLMDAVPQLLELPLEDENNKVYLEKRYDKNAKN